MNIPRLPRPVILVHGAGLAVSSAMPVQTLAAAHTPQLEDPDGFAAAIIAAFGPR